MRTFQDAVHDQRHLIKKQRTKEHKKLATKKKAVLEETARRLALFQAAATTLEALMNDDLNFAEYLKKTVDFKGNIYTKNIASVEFGTHAEHYGWVGDMTETFKNVKTDWCLVIALSDTGKVRFEIYTNRSQQRQPESLDNVPKKVCIVFQPILKALQDKRKVYDLLLSKHSI